MNFIEAIKLIKEQGFIKVMRGDTQVFYSDWSGNLYIEHENETEHGFKNFEPTVEDILSEDWHVVKNEKLHTFEEALKAYKSGKNIRRNHHGMMHHDDYCSFDRDDVMANDWIIMVGKV
jgi:hypothetical protein